MEQSKHLMVGAGAAAVLAAAGGLIWTKMGKTND